MFPRNTIRGWTNGCSLRSKATPVGSGPLKWAAILLQGLCTLVAIAMVHSDNRPTCAIAMAIFATGGQNSSGRSFQARLRGPSADHRL
jgi:hypothetical protein